MNRCTGVMAGFAICMLASLVAGRPAHAQMAPYEVWACGEFNCQGYVDEPTIQFYPFSHKIGDLYKIDLSESMILVLNPTPSGNFFGYLMWRADGAPIWWLWLDARFQLVNSNELFPSCSYSVAVP